MRAVQFPSYEKSPPKLVAGARGLDFLNTIEWRGDPGARGERLTSYAELLAWGEKAGILARGDVEDLMAEAGRHPRAATRVLHAAIALREATAAALTAPAIDSRALERLNGRLSGVRFEFRVERAAGGSFRSAVEAVGSPLHRPLDLIAREVVSMLSSHPRQQIHACGNARCGWFFIDASRNGARRWCQMATCGNQAKARAHYARRRRMKKASTTAA
jgi:predicted RNA-binding Zn ribbon-like protein